MRYYSDLMNYAATTGDSTALLAVSDSGCEVCRDYANAVKDSNAANGGLEGDYREKLKQVTDLARGKSGRIRGAAILTVGAYTSKVKPTDPNPLVIQATTYRRELALSPQGGSWVMYEMRLIEQ